VKGEAMGRAAGVWHHRRWMKVMEVPHEKRNRNKTAFRDETNEEVGLEFNDDF
jgi:hypothetical protein